MNKIHQTSIRFDKKTQAAIEKAAKAQGVRASDLIRTAAIAYLGVCPTCGQARHDVKSTRRDDASQQTDQAVA